MPVVVARVVVGGSESSSARINRYVFRLFTVAGERVAQSVLERAEPWLVVAPLE
jgi:hypothetical protein